MKANILYRLIFTAILIAGSMNSVLALIKIGIEENTGTQLKVTYTADMDYNTGGTNIWNSQVFTMRWPTSLGSDFVGTISNEAAFLFIIDGPAQDGGDGYFYQKFASASTNVTQNINNGQTIHVLFINVTHLMVPVGTFQLVTQPNEWVVTNNGQANVESATLGEQFHTFDPVSAPSSPLPVDIRHVKVKANLLGMHILWTSENEHNLATYEIQRSEDGRMFKTIGEEEPAGGSGTHDYSFEDKGVRPGVEYYYRLKILDLDGSFSYSPVLSAIMPGGDFAANLFPNPTSGHIFLEWHSEKEGQLTASIFTESGILLWSRDLDALEGVNRMELQLNDLPPAMYLLRVTSSGRIFESKIILSR